MAITAGEDILAADFIFEADADPTPADDLGRVAKLESDAKISEQFLRYASKFTAGEDLLANIPVGIGVDGKISRAVRGYATSATNVPSDLDGAIICDVISVDTNKFVLIYAYSSIQNVIKCVAYEVDTDTHAITFGGAETISSNAETTFGGVCKLDTNKFIATHSDDGSNDCGYKIMTLSGVTITAQSNGNLASSSVTYGTLCQLDTDKFAFFYTAGDANVTYMGFATVSGYTPTVVDSSTSSLTNFTNTDQVRMTKIATDKFVMVSPETGYAVVCTTASSTLVIGTAVDMGDASSGQGCDVISISTDTFFAKLDDEVLYVTVSGTTITIADSDILGVSTTNGDLFTDGTNVHEFINSSVAGVSGIYKIEYTGSAVVRTQLQSFQLGSTGGVRGAYDGATYTLIGGVATNGSPAFHIKGMTANYIGFTDVAADKDDVIRVNWKGRIGGQTGITPGATYEILNGGLSRNFDLTKKYTVLGAEDSTHIFI